MAEKHQLFFKSLLIFFCILIMNLYVVYAQWQNHINKTKIKLFFFKKTKGPLPSKSDNLSVVKSIVSLLCNVLGILASLLLSRE